MDVTCRHCGYINNNHFFCSGCGRELKFESKPEFEKLPENSTIFLNEVKKTIDRLFHEETAIQSLEVTKVGLSISDIARESGVMIIDGGQWKEPDRKVRISCFYADISLTYILSLALSILAAVVGSAGSEILMKMFFSSYIFCAFMLWFIFPFISGLTAFSFIGYRCGIFKDGQVSVRGNVTALMMLFVVVVFYSFPPFFLIEYIVATRFEKYVPAAQKAAGVDYLLKIGGE